MVSEAKGAGALHGVGFGSANLLRTLSVIAALAASVVVLGATMTPAQATFPGENGKIAFYSGEGKIYTVEPDGSNLKQLTSGQLPTWSPDGTEIIVAKSGGAKLSVVSADGPNVGTSHTVRGAFTWDSAWFPDGTELAFSAVAPSHGNNDIYMMDLDGSNKTNLTKTPRLREFYPAFSPNGSQIGFSRESENLGKSVMGIYVMDADGSDPTLLFKTESLEQFDWSPDGKKIALSPIIDSKKDGHQSELEIYVINADGSGGTALTRNSALEDSPAWSPDGKKITFASDRDGDYDIYTMDADGSDVAQVTNLPGDDYSPDWQPLPGTTVHPPDTGGPSLLLVASALLFSGSVILYAVARPRM